MSSNAMKCSFSFSASFTVCKEKNCLTKGCQNGPNFTHYAGRMSHTAESEEGACEFEVKGERKKEEEKEVGQSDQPVAFFCVHHVVSYCTGQFAKKNASRRELLVFFYLFQVATLLRETGDVVCQRFNRFKRFGPFLHLELSDLCANFCGYRKLTTAGKRKRHRQKQASISGCFFLPKHDQPPRHFRLVTGTWKRRYGRPQPLVPVLCRSLHPFFERRGETRTEKCADVRIRLVKTWKPLVILGFGRLTPKKTGVFGLFWVLGPPAIPGIPCHSWELAFLGIGIPGTPIDSLDPLPFLGPPTWTEKPHKRGKKPKKKRGVLGLTTLKNLAF